MIWIDHRVITVICNLGHETGCQSLRTACSMRWRSTSGMRSSISPGKGGKGTSLGNKAMIVNFVARECYSAGKFKAVKITHRGYTLAALSMLIATPATAQPSAAPTNGADSISRLCSVAGAHRTWTSVDKDDGIINDYDKESSWVCKSEGATITITNNFNDVDVVYSGQSKKDEGHRLSSRVRKGATTVVVPRGAIASSQLQDYHGKSGNWTILKLECPERCLVSTHVRFEDDDNFNHQVKHLDFDDRPSGQASFWPSQALYIWCEMPGDCIAMGRILYPQ
jgi:hypothetical protein